MDELWKEVYGFDTLYEVSNFGRVRTKFHGTRGYQPEYKFVEACDNGKGYKRFNWKVNGIQKTVYLHWLVATYFVENPCGFCEVNHKDENKANNKAENLEWCLHVYNCNYGTRNIRSGAKNGKRIRCIETGQIFESIKKAAIFYNVALTSISNCLNGRTRTSCGHTWEYVE